MTKQLDSRRDFLKGSTAVVAGATLAGITVNDLILWATLLYLVLQIGFLLYRWGRIHFGKRPVSE